MNPRNRKLDELRDEYGTNSIPYGKLLQTTEWQVKREIIIKRDGNCCALCGKKATVWMGGQGWTPGYY